jgi:prepilin-type N-terminal cleavage/methylation domain-containing protein
MMIVRRLEFKQDQRGFTLIELVVALSIASLIIGVIGMTIFSVLIGNAISVSSMTAVREAQHAGVFLSRDAIRAQCISPAAGLPLTLTWEDGGTLDEYEAVYTHLEDNTLQRELYVNEVLDSDTIVARDITAIDSQYSGDKLTWTITSTAGSWRTASETKTYQLVHRAETESGG